MAEFKWYLNRQGVRGTKGDKGDKGFSPYIVQKEVSKEKYILHVQNETEDQSFDTPNLKEGLVPEDLGGTYVRLNTETGNQYYGDADVADTTTKGVIRVASDNEVANAADVVAAVTPLQVNENYSTKTETQKVSDAVTTLEEQERSDVLALGKRITTNDENINNLNASVKKNASDITTLKTDVSKLKTTTQEQTTNITNLQTGKQNKLVAGDNVTLTDQTDGTTKIDVTTSGGGTGDVTAAGDNTFTGSNTFTKNVNAKGLDVQASLTAKSATITNLQVQNTLTSSNKINAIEIEAGSIHDSNNKKYLTEVDVDNQTIQVVDGKLHANLDELGNEVNTLSGEVTSLTGDLNDLTGRVTASEADILTLKTSVASKQTKLTAGDNITLTDLSDGTVKIDAAGGSEAPANMVTTDTEQEITGKKYVIGNILTFKRSSDDTAYGFIGRGTSPNDLASTRNTTINNIQCNFVPSSSTTAGVCRLGFHYPSMAAANSKCYIETRGFTNGKTDLNIYSNQAEDSTLNLQGATSKIEIGNDGIRVRTSNNYSDPDTSGATGTFSMMVLSPLIPNQSLAYSPILNVNDARNYFKAGDGIVRTLEKNASESLVTGYTWSVGTIDGGDSTTT